MPCTCPQDAKEAAAAAVAACHATGELWRSQHPESVRDSRTVQAAEERAGGALGAETQLMQSMSVRDIKEALTQAGGQDGNPDWPSASTSQNIEHDAAVAEIDDQLLSQAV
jgi:hypothetical protein